MPRVAKVKKDKSITVSCTQRQYDSWMQLAEMHNLSMSEFMRKCVETYAGVYTRKYGMKYDPVENVYVKV